MSELQNLSFHILRRKPYRCQYFSIVFGLFSVVVAVSTYLCLCCLLPLLLSYVIVSRLCHLTEFCPNRARFAMSLSFVQKY